MTISQGNNYVSCPPMTKRENESGVRKEARKLLIGIETDKELATGNERTYIQYIQSPKNVFVHGLVNFVLAVPYLFCLNLPAAVSQPRTKTFFGLCRVQWVHGSGDAIKKGSRDCLRPLMSLRQNMKVSSNFLHMSTERFHGCPHLACK